jgi:polysaccharide biosynthesis protein PslH
MPPPSGDSLSKPAALVICPETPYPMIGGGPLRTVSLLRAMKRKYDVDLIVFREPDAPDPRAAVPSGAFRNIDVIDLPYHSREPLARAGRNLKRYLRGAPPLIDRFSGFDGAIGQVIAQRRYSVGVIEHFWCARYIEVLRPACNRVVLNLHNIESTLLERTAATENWAISTVMRRFASACHRLEDRLLPEFSLILVASEIDKAIAVRAAPLVPIIVYPNAIPLVPRPRPPSVDEIVFSGNLDYQPNISAVRFFHQSVWPLLHKRWPQLRWRLVGRNHERLQAQLSGDRSIDFTGPVEDAIGVIARARAAVVPVLAGSGTRIKILEAWAAGVPVVSTQLGAEGLPGVPGEHLLIADSPDEFVSAVSSILESTALGKILGDNGRLLYETDLTWEAAWKALERSGL